MNYDLPGYDSWLQGPTRCTECGAKYYLADGGCTACDEGLEAWLEELDDLLEDDANAAADLARTGTFAADGSFPRAQEFFDAGLSPQDVVDGEQPPELRHGWVANG